MDGLSGFYLSLGILSRKGETSFVLLTDTGLVHNTRTRELDLVRSRFFQILSRSLRRPTNMNELEIAGIVLAPHLINRTAVAIKYVAIWLLRRADIEHPI